MENNANVVGDCILYSGALRASKLTFITYNRPLAYIVSDAVPMQLGMEVMRNYRSVLRHVAVNSNAPLRSVAYQHRSRLLRALVSDHE